MGGHGGLNILPQKKWNVYNWDNRQIVERDKRIHQEKKRKQYEENREQMLQNKINVLKEENQPFLHQFKQQEERPNQSLLNQEMRKIADQHKHVNLFEEQQRILMNRQAIELKRLKEEQFLKDKNMDYSTRFLGSYNDQKSMPWYSKKKGFEPQQRRNKYYRNLDDVIYGKKTESRITKEVIEAEKRQGSKVHEDNKRDRTREKLYTKYEEYEDKCARIEAKQSLLAKDLLKHEEDLLIKELKDTKERQMERLREKRLRRQEKERKRIQQLKNKKEK